MTPSFKNQPVQGTGDDASAGYHGYWITDFTQIDPHLGTNADLKTLIDEAHAKGIKVFFDIITNHTADVIDNTEGTYDYITKADQPVQGRDRRRRSTTATTSTATRSRRSMPPTSFPLPADVRCRPTRRTSRCRPG